MTKALLIGHEMAGKTSPNPSVGAVLVREGKVVGQGATQPPGGPHAEIVALRQAGEAARGADLYVTLEPCSHYGRTPPCTEAVIAAGVRSVHAATRDPNPLVSGRGLQALRDAGIPVVEGEGARDARQAHEAFFTYIVKRRPFVTVLVRTAWGANIAVSGIRRTDGAQPARHFGATHATASAVCLAGTGVVRDRRSPSGRVLCRLPHPDRADRDLEAGLTRLADEGYTSLLVTGSGALLPALFRAGLVDKVLVLLTVPGAGRPRDVDLTAFVPSWTVESVERAREGVLVTVYPDLPPGRPSAQTHVRPSAVATKPDPAVMPPAPSFHRRGPVGYRNGSSASMSS